MKILKTISKKWRPNRLKNKEMELISFKMVKKIKLFSFLSKLTIPS